ncbi:hypothetical protein ABZX62_00200 [Streptomyces flavidovirens]|uniref:hypothetical protein n=1 Tax=Streptomyces flavidovirens TaxID=67298 RepID=UPI0033A7D871
MNISLTVGGLAVGLSILVWYLLRWWHSQKAVKGSKDWRALSPFGSGIGLGILAASCAGGVLGTIAGWIRSLSNTAGDKAISGATGNGAQPLSSAAVPALTAGGALLTVVAFVALFALWKKIKDASRKPLALGSVCGCTLGMSSGIVGSVALALVPLVNSAGDTIIGVI